MSLLFWIVLGIAIVELPLAFLGVAYVVFLVRNRKAIRLIIEMDKQKAGNNNVRGIS